MVCTARSFIAVVSLLLVGDSSCFVIPQNSWTNNECATLETALHAANPADTATEAKTTLIELLKGGEDENSPKLTPYVDALKRMYAASDIDARYSHSPSYNGDWVNVNTPAFPGRLGLTKDGLSTYTIGRLTFNLIPSTKDVVCAVEKMVQHVHHVPSDKILSAEAELPESLCESWKHHPSELRSNKIDTLFQIPDSNVRGILRMEGYTMPDAKSENKYNTWFVGGRCLPQHGVDQNEWIQIFGAEQTVESKLHYTLPIPMEAYQTVEYLDDDLRISVGNRGTLMIVQREQ